MQSVGRTWLRRPELIGRVPLDAERRGLLEEFLQRPRDSAGET
jgi:tRNA (guanine37-N1)-methyltransferase